MKAVYWICLCVFHSPFHIFLVCTYLYQVVKLKDGGAIFVMENLEITGRLSGQSGVLGQQLARYDRLRCHFFSPYFSRLWLFLAHITLKNLSKPIRVITLTNVWTLNCSDQTLISLSCYDQILILNKPSVPFNLLSPIRVIFRFQFKDPSLHVKTCIYHKVCMCKGESRLWSLKLICIKMKQS